MIGLMCGLTVALAHAQPASTSAGQTESQVMSALMRMAEFLAQAPRFSVTMDIGYDVMQDWGQKLEFVASRPVTVQRPVIPRRSVGGCRSS